MLIGLSGYAQSGKDTVGNHLVVNHGFTRLAFADALKEMAYVLDPIVEVGSFKEEIRLSKIVDSVGWDIAKKQEEVRRILQVLGTECCRDLFGNDVWVNVLAAKLSGHQGNVVVTDVRFLNEAYFIKRHGELWWIDRKGVVALNDHSSENTLSHTFADLIVFNNSHPNELYMQINRLMERSKLTDA